MQHVKFSHLRAALLLAGGWTLLNWTVPGQATDFMSLRNTSGLWSTKAAWTHMPPPPTPRFPANGGADSFFVSLEDEAVTLDVDVTISSLDISSGGSLTWLNPGGVRLVLDAGPVGNSGTMTLNDNDSLGIGGEVSLSGSGALILSGPNSRINDTAGGRLTVAGHTISGQGVVGGTSGFDVTNDGGLIVANVADATLSVDPTNDLTQINGGVLRATDGGTLLLSGGFFDNTFGTIEAMPGSTVKLRFADILGGTLIGSGTGQFRVDTRPSTSRFDTLTLAEGTLVDMDAGTSLELAGTITNNGQIAPSSTPSFATSIVIEGTATLAGNGTITLDDEDQERIVRKSSAAMLVHNAGHTVEGAGIFGEPTVDGPRIDNRGLITANRSGELLKVFIEEDDGETVGLRNSATLQATSGGRLFLQGGTIAATNTAKLRIGGTINNRGRIRASGQSLITFNDVTIDAAGAGPGQGTIEARESTILLDDLELPGSATLIRGGLLATTGSGTINNTSSATLDGATSGPITLDGDLLGEDGSTTNLTGTLQLQDGATFSLEPDDRTTQIVVVGAAQLTDGGSGTGKVKLKMPQQAGGLARITGLAGSTPVLTNGPGVTIEGPAGSIGGGGLVVVNQGTIQANTDPTLDLTSVDVINTGSLAAKNGATLRIEQAEVVNASGGTDGTIRAEDGSVVELTGGSIIFGGSLDTVGTGIIRTIGSATLVTPIENRGVFETANGATTTVVGAQSFGDETVVTNSGTMRLSSEGLATRIRVTGRGSHAADRNRRNRSRNGVRPIDRQWNGDAGRQARFATGGILRARRRPDVQDLDR